LITQLKRTEFELSNANENFYGELTDITMAKVDFLKEMIAPLTGAEGACLEDYRAQRTMRGNCGTCTVASVM
jgi:hypothetical protein